MDVFNAPPPEEERGLLKRLGHTVRKSVFYGMSLTRLSFLSLELLEKEIAMLVPDINIGETIIPFACVATDLKNSEVCCFREGPMRNAIVASCAIPGLFPPVKHDGKEFIDGSWAVQSPVEYARGMGADFVIAVNIDPENDEEMELRNGLDVVLVGNKVTRRVLAKMQLGMADVVVTPDIHDFHWADFSHSAESVEIGKSCAQAAIKDIKKKLNRARIKNFFHLG
ncbi:MAG: hypothetical protein IEMM0002_0713 [bacterium]|nr:MAG: hypothetical protein IEMM0002_0713 [bacterium]